MNYPLFTSESVASGHPDKICDQISDAVLDEALRIDPLARVGCETLAASNKLVLAGEITCEGRIDFEGIARKVIKELGYTRKELGFWDGLPVEVCIHQQSRDIALGVDRDGAGDQGMMFGYACRETEALMPLPIWLAHDLVRGMDELHSTLPYLRPDGKSEVVVRYENGQPAEVVKIVLAKPHEQTVEKEEVRQEFYQRLVTPLLNKYKLKAVGLNQLILNGTGKWETGGPSSDAGLTGRKIVVDTYGGMARIGGGCFSGKDPTKVDRSAAYAARFIAKNIVAAGLADRCEAQLSYVIGHREPLVKAIETFGTAKAKMGVIEDFAWGLLDLSVKGIVAGLDLQRPIYKNTARYGHFGYSDYPWEKIIG